MAPPNTFFDVDEVTSVGIVSDVADDIESIGEEASLIGKASEAIE